MLQSKIVNQTHLKRAVTAALFAVLLLSCLWLPLSFQTAKADTTTQTIRINPDGSINPSTVPITNVDNRVYTLTSNMLASLVIERENIVFDGAGHSLTGNRVDNSNGIQLSNTNNVTITNVVVSNFYTGIFFGNTNNSAVTNSQFTNNKEAGIGGASSYIAEINGYLQIILRGNYNASITGNQVTNNYLGADLRGFIYGNFTNNIIHDNTIRGLELVSSNYTTVASNQITNNGNVLWDYGFLVSGSTNNTIKDNTLGDSSGGVFLADTSNNTITGNTFTNDGLTIDNPSGAPYCNTIQNNFANGKPIVYLEGASGITVQPDAAQVILVNCSTMKVQNLNLNLETGIELLNTTGSLIARNNLANINGLRLFYSSNNNTVLSNSFNYNWVGINMQYSGNNSILQNNFQGTDMTLTYSHKNVVRNNFVNGKPLIYLENAAGITVPLGGEVILVDCTNIKVQNQEITNTYLGIELWNTNNTEITNCNINGNVEGIWLYCSSNNRIAATKINDNQNIGLLINLASDSNTVTGNELRGDRNGVVLGGSSSNTVTQNKIIGNSARYPNGFDNGYGMQISSGAYNLPYPYEYTGASFNVISENTIANFTKNGIQTYSADKNLIAQNTIIDNKENGIYAGGCMYLTISANNITGNKFSGIKADSAYNANVESNIVSANNDNGIEMAGCFDSVIAKNTVTNTKVNNGLRCLYAINCTITSNRLSNNNLFGLQLLQSTSNNITSNTMENNRNSGMYITDASDKNSIVANNVTGNGVMGISVNASQGNKIQSNLVQKSANSGILLNGCPNGDVSKNNITNNGFFGVSLAASINNTVMGNYITLNANSGIMVGYGCTRNVIMLNNVNQNNAMGIGLAQSSGNSIVWNNVTGNVGGGLSLNWASTNVLVNNRAQNNNNGLVSQNSSYNYIASNSFIENKQQGINLATSSGNAITQNYVSNNGYVGIALTATSNNNTLSTNYIENSLQGGISINSKSSSNLITQNSILDNVRFGINLNVSTNNILCSNTLTNNTQGICLNSTSTNNFIIENTISSNTNCAINLTSSSGNFVYHNNFQTNADNVHSYNSVNVWDQGYPSGGNYWSNQQHVDRKKGTGQNQLGSDGVTDTKYTLDTSNVDYYPLNAAYTPTTTSSPVTSVQLSPAGPNGNNGWYTTSPVVSLIALGSGGSGIKEMHYKIDANPEQTVMQQLAVPHIVTLPTLSDGSHTVEYWSVDNSGNTEAHHTLTLNIDTTAPTINLFVPSTVRLHECATATWSASDSCSGISGDSSGRIRLDTDTAGAHTVTITVTDKAGNTATATKTYKVSYCFGGFRPPIHDDDDGCHHSCDDNDFRLGSTIPVKFELQDDDGRAVTDAQATLYVAKVVNGVVGQDLAPQSSCGRTIDNHFRVAGRQYMFNLDTDFMSKGVWQLKAVLDDGSAYTVRITLK